MVEGNLRNKTIKGFFWQFGQRISSQLASFVISIILARLLMPKDYGVIALAMVFITITGVLASGGLGTALVQKKEVDELDRSTILWAGFAMSIGLYGILFLAAPFIADIYHNDLVCTVLRALGLTIPISAINSVQQSIVSRNMEFKIFFFVNIIVTIASGFVGVAMAYTGFGIWALIGQSLSSSIVSTITLNRFIKWKPMFAFSLERFKDMFSFGVNLMLANLMGTVFDQLKSFIIGAKYKPADLAFYNRGSSLPSIISDNINSTISSVLFPALTKLQGDKNGVKAGIRRSMMTSSYLVFPMLLILAVTADKIIFFLLTDKWMPAVPYMRVFCLNYCVSILGMTNLQAINAIGRSDVTFKLEFIKKPVYIIFIIIAMFISPLAIAAANAIYGFVGFAVNAFPNKKLINYTYKEQIMDILPQTIISIGIAGLVYLVGLLQINMVVLLILQWLVGLGAYWVITKSLHLECYNYIMSTIKDFIKK